MKVRTKRSIRILLSALLVLVMAFQSLAAPVSYAGPTAASDPAKVTGTWSKDAAGNWNFNARDGAAKDGWYYLNTTNKATDYNWFHFTNGVMNTGWVQDKTDLSVWYYTGETKDSSEGGMVKGWATDPRDGKKYYMDPSTGIMRYGWQLIGNVWYYFGEKQYANASHPYGAMYVNERTPDGYYVGSNGGWIQNHSENDSDDPVGPVVVPVTGVSLDKSEVTLGVGDTCTLNAAVAPANATNKNVKWSSSDSTVVTVDAAGKVTAVAEGTATITVTTVDGGKTATCKVTVTTPVVPVTNVSLEPSTLKLSVSEDQTLTATVAPANATNKSVTWSSDKTDVATVDNTGKVTAVAAGTAIITVTTVDGNKTATCTVTVFETIADVLAKAEGEFPTSESPNPPTNAWVANNENKCYVYNEMLNFYKNSENSWNVSTSYNEVTKNGDAYFSEVYGGTITFTMDDGKLKSIEFAGDQDRQDYAGTYAPVVPVTGVSLDSSELTLAKDGTRTLTATVAPANATNKSVTWSSNNTDIATVDETGTVTAVAAGTATITVTTVDGSKTATCTVTVFGTIADVLATVEGGFPEGTGNKQPSSNAWVCGDGHFTFVYNSVLIFYYSEYVDPQKGKVIGNATGVPVSTEVTQGENGYTATINTIKLTFNMTDGKLTGIVFSSTTPNMQNNYGGTYVPAAPAPASTSQLFTAPLAGGEESPAEETASIEAEGTVEDVEAEKDHSIPVEKLETEIPEAVVPEIAAEAKPEEAL